jgi:hypothetical protein
MTKLDELNQALERLVKTALRVKEERDALYLALKAMRDIWGWQPLGPEEVKTIEMADSAIALAERP